MALSIHGTPAAAAGTSITLPTHSVGDLILICAYRDGNTAVPTKPAAGGTVPAWVDVDAAAGANLNSMIVCQFVATATNHTSGTWTNATGMAAIVYSGAAASPIGAHNQTGSAVGSGGSLTSAALTSPVLDGTSAFVYFFGWRTVTAWSAAPAGYTRQAQVATECEILTKDVTTSEASFSASGTASASGGYRVQAVEVKAAAAAGVTIALNGVASGQALGIAKLSLTDRLVGVASAAQLGLAQLKARLQAISVGSGEALGTPHLTWMLYPPGVGSGQALGLPKLAVNVKAISVQTGEARGSAKLGLRLEAVSVASAEAHGRPLLTFSTILTLTGIPSGEAHGSPRLALTGPVLSVQTAQALGLVRLVLTGRLVGVASSAQAGGPTLALKLRTIAVASGEQLGTPKLALASRMVGVVSGERLGQPLLVMVSVAGAPGVPGGVYLSDLATFAVKVDAVARFAVLPSDLALFGAAVDDRVRFAVTVADLETDDLSVSDNTGG